MNELVVQGIENDSRRVASGDLFLAYQGEVAHGLDFLSQALERGAVAVAWDAPDRESIVCSQFNVAVPDLRNQAGIIANRFYDHPSEDMSVIAVTGTDGKTSVTHFVAEALNLSQRHCGIIGTLGMGFLDALRESPNTTPDSLVIHRTARELKDAGADHLVLEASSHGLDQGRLNGLAVDVAVLTNIGTDHLDYHVSHQEYVEAKCKLFQISGLHYAVVNRDSEYRDAIVRGCTAERILEYSTQDQKATAYLQDVSSSRSGLTARILCEGRELVLQTSLLGDFNVENLMAALLVLVTQGMTPEQAVQCLSQVKPVRGRMETVTCAEHGMIVLDYAHTPLALEKVLRTCRAYCDGRVICVFGCGGERDRGKRPMMGEVASRLADYVIITSDNPRGEDPDQIVSDIQQGISMKDDCVAVIPDRKAAIEYAIAESRPDDVVVVAGKGHERKQITREGAVAFEDIEVIKAAAERMQ